jgi:spermidine/putrescine transport system substrate-binding protein
MAKSRAAVTRRGFLRRSFAATGAAAGFSALNFLMPRASYGQDAMTKELVISTWGGFFSDAVKEAIVEPFQKEYGVRVHIGVTGNQVETLAKLKAASLGGGDGGIDVMWNDLSFSYAAIQQGLVETLRIANIPNYNTVLPVFNKLQRPVPWDPGPDVHGAPGQLASRGVTYNTKFIKRDLTLLEELWNPEFKGRLGIVTNTQWMVANGAYRTGQDANKIPDLEKVWQSLREQRPLVGRYYSNNAEGQELFKNETMWISPFNGGRTVDLRRQGMNLGYYKPKEGWMLNADLLMIGKGSKNRFTAEKFLDFTYRPEIATKSSELQAFPIATRNVQATEIVKSLPDFDPTGELAGAVLPDPPFWDANMSRFTEKVKEIITA